MANLKGSHYVELRCSARLLASLIYINFSFFPICFPFSLKYIKIMQAAVLEEKEKLELKDIPKPIPEEGEILIEVKSCAICGTDIKVFHHGHKHIHFPRVTGHEVSGIIVALGKNVEEYQKGERVAVAPAIPCGKCYYCRRGIEAMCENLTAIGYHYDGGFAQFMKVPRLAVSNGCVNPIPENLSFQEASLAEPLACVINGQELSKTGLGDTVAIIGAGPIGCFHAELARIKGAKKVILVEISSARLEKAKFTGSDVYINSGKENLPQRVLEETKGRGADKVIVAVGSKKAQEDSLKIVAKCGILNFFGGLPKEDTIINFDSNLLHYGEFYVVGTHGSAPRHNQLALDILAAGKIDAKAYITEKFCLSEIKKGLKMAEDKKGLKIIIQP